MPQKITRREFIRRTDGAAASLPLGKIYSCQNRAQRLDTIKRCLIPLAWLATQTLSSTSPASK